jgi:hypothetical protein
MDGDTEAFLARHRSNTHRYMNKLNLPKDKPDRLDANATLKRLQDKYGLTPERTEERTDDVRVSVDEQNIKDFIKTVRMKYLVSTPPSDKPDAITPEAPRTPKKETEQEKPIQHPVVREPLIVMSPRHQEPLIDLSSPAKEQQPLDLLTGPQPNDLLSLNLSPRKPPSSPVKSPGKEAAKISPRSDSLMSLIISNAVSKRLGICRRPSSSPKPTKLQNFDSFLSAKRPSPVRTTRHRDIAKLYTADSELQALVKKEQTLVERLK